MNGHAKDALRTARLILDAELAEGAVAEDEVADIARQASDRRSQVGRLVPKNFQRLAMKVGLADGLASMLDESIALRRLALGPPRDGPPRFLVRVDEFPYSAAWYDPVRYGVDATRAFHDVLLAEGVPYLLAVLPRPADDYLDPEAGGARPIDGPELELLQRMSHDGVAFGQHGATHRTRFRSPRRHSELCGLDSAAMGRLLGDAQSELDALGITTTVFVPPFNRFDASQWAELARRYAVVTGGPESVRLVGSRPAPVWWGEAVYLPCYPPLYADARTILGSLDHVLRVGPGCWVPIVLHTAWEIDDGLASLRRLAKRLAGHAVPWARFLGAVERSRPLPV